MKLFKYALLLIVLVGFVSVASATITDVQLSGIYDPVTPDYFQWNTEVIVTATVTGSAAVDIKWYSPEDLITPIFNDNNMNTPPYISTHTPSVEGLWTVTVKQASQTVTKTFYVKGLPEFPVGSFISLLLVCGLYLMLRRNMVGS